MNHDGDGRRVLGNTASDVNHRKREVIALAALVVVLAALWVATFFSSTRVWGEYRPAEAEVQEPPPPPTIIVPALSLDEAREIVERASALGVGAHDPR